MLLEGILRLQAGVIGRDQALAAGLSARQIEYRVRRGRWLRLHPHVYVAADRELTDHARVHAAAIWAGEPSTVSGLAAAWWLGLWPDPPSLVELTVPERRRLRPRSGVRVRRRDIGNADRVGVRGLWVTGVPLTVLEAAVAVGTRGSELIDRALQQRVSVAALYRAHHRNLGRRGSAAAGRLLAAATDQAASAAERRVITMLRSANLQGWRLHYRLNGYELDVAFADYRLAIEIDGWAWHQNVNAFRNDRRKQNTVVLAGWTVLRFTWHDLINRPGDVIGEILAALRTLAVSSGQTPGTLRGAVNAATAISR